MHILLPCRFEGPQPIISRICGEDVVKRLKPIWGLTPEGEFQTVWRETGVPNFWIMMGNLAWCRFHSKHLALRESLLLSESRRWSARLLTHLAEIKAIEEGLLKNEDRYV